jgi:hypothetical protein
MFQISGCHSKRHFEKQNGIHQRTHDVAPVNAVMDGRTHTHTRTHTRAHTHTHTHTHAQAHTQELYDTSQYTCKKADTKVRGNLPPQLGRISQYSGTANQPL